MAYTSEGYSARQILAYKQRVELLPMTVTTDGVAEGATFKFLIGDNGTDEATTRGANGNIQYSALPRSQATVTMEEWIAAYRETGFNIFTSQQSGQIEKMMQDACNGKISRKKDQIILSALSGATLSTGTATVASFSQVQKALTTLQNAGVPSDGFISMVVSPAYKQYMSQWTEFNNAQLVGTEQLTLSSGGPVFTNQIQMWRWNGLNVIVHPKLAGVGTNNETCYIYHNRAVGLGFNTSAEKIAVGFNDEQRYSYVNQETYIGAVILQNTGIVKIPHDGSALQLS